MVMRNLKYFEGFLRKNKPLFQVEVLLANPDVVLFPTANEIYKLTLQCMRDLVEGYVSYCFFIIEF